MKEKKDTPRKKYKYDVKQDTKGAGWVTEKDIPIVPKKNVFDFKIGDPLYIKCYQAGLGTKFHEFELEEVSGTIFRVNRETLLKVKVYECFMIADYENGLLEIIKMEEILNG